MPSSKKKRQTTQTAAEKESTNKKTKRRRQTTQLSSAVVCNGSILPVEREGETDTGTLLGAGCAIEHGALPYRKLDSKKNGIRLAEVRMGGLHGDLVTCTMRYTSLDHPPAYQALSYTWGDPKDCTDIDIGGFRVPVTRNLESGLRRMHRAWEDRNLVTKNSLATRGAARDASRAAGKPLLLWVDAICINQKDHVEKSEQILMMRHIYRQAERVDIWLGPACDKSATAWQLVEDILHCPAAGLSAMIRQPARRSMFEALKKLFRRDYWWRIWVIQEVACSSTATVYCGEKSMSWVDLDKVCQNLSKAKENLIKHQYHDDPSSVYSLLAGGPRGLRLTKFSSRESPPLLELLLTHKSKYATDPRDKVYGLIGISDAPHSFEIDYARSIRDTFIYTARHIIQTTSRLNVICVKQKQDADLPTWVPNWTRIDAYPAHRIVGLHHRLPPFRASDGMTATVAFSTKEATKAPISSMNVKVLRTRQVLPSVAEETTVLWALGFVVDRVEKTGKACDLNGDDSSSDLRVTLQAFEDWWNLFVAHFASTPTVPQQEAFERTLCGGQWAPAYELHASQRLHSFHNLLRKELPQHPSMSPTIPFTLLPEGDDLLNKTDQRAMVSSASLRMHDKLLAILGSNLLSLAPAATQPGDLVVILFGCSFPVVLRPQDKHYLLIGEAYVDGIMDGEAVRDAARRVDEECMFAIH